MTYSPAKRAQAGFTLVELMVVIIIMGVLAASATIMFNSDPTGEASRELASLLTTARRKAIEMGPVPADVAADEGRARVRVEVATSNERNTITFYYLLDSGEWQPDHPVALAQKAHVYGVNITRAQTLEGGSLPTQLADSDSETVDFFPDGSATAQTWFLEHRYKTNGEKFRVYVMPLSGQIEAAKNW